MGPTATPEQAELSEAAVADYLARNPDFFDRHGDVLAKLELRHGGRGTVSLLDRQVQRLRGQNTDLRQRLGEIVENATDNDGTFAQTRTFTLALMDCNKLAGLDDILARHLVAGFHADHGTCFVHDWATGQTDENARFRHLASIGRGQPVPWPRLFDLDDPVCTACRPEDYRSLFPAANPTEPGSVAIIPMRTCKGAGPGDRTNVTLNAALVVGALDPRRFAPDMGKVFLYYIGDVMSRTLFRLLHART